MMIFIEYKNEVITSSRHKGKPIITIVEKLAQENPSAILLIYKEGQDISFFKSQVATIMQPHIIISLHNNLNDDLGYVEDSPFLARSSSSCYPTWLKK
ncbi:glycosyl transferase [Nonlabens ulvanivorans]|uniref:Glycosyl transferase n=1 Tax=Nonlabens ulvanivorans TaxID=906888 RepID=A0A090QVA2_NONUL|nr:hypothetical protein [Nonlabens ulvanivorans]GAK99371.1 glycosyl transferase [Nonlabens ulvanivorans]